MAVWTVIAEEIGYFTSTAWDLLSGVAGPLIEGIIAPTLAFLRDMFVTAF